MLDREVEKLVLAAGRSEITEYFIYEKLAESMKDARNREVLKRISSDELKHYEFWRKYTRKELKPSKFTVWKYFLISKIFGVTFGVKLMERGEGKAQLSYGRISEFMPDARKILEDEVEHERQLTSLIDEERLRYVGSMVLGLNDALVEFTGALAGYTFALQNTSLVAMTGLITGVAASLSMATSEYLSTKSEGNAKTLLRQHYILVLLMFLLFCF
jgi:VIT1/CCC1 family predicted Fe2+/Mn2+ transporter